MTSLTDKLKERDAVLLHRDNGGPMLGDRYTQYRPTRDCSLTVVNLKQFKAWLAKETQR